MLTISAPKNHIKNISILTKRNLLRFYRDKMDVGITFIQAPALAIVFFAVFQKIATVEIMKKTVFFQPLRHYLNDDTRAIIIFLAVLTAIWFGTSKAITEIPKNKILYQQEKLSFLNSFDFIVSNFIGLAAIVFGQVFFFTLSFHLLFVTFPAKLFPELTGILCTGNETDFLSFLMPVLFIKLTLLMWLIGMASIAVSTLISICVKTTSAANAILPIVLIIQILLGGSIIKPVKDMSPVIQVFASVMVSRWGFEAAVLLFEDKLNLSLPCSPDGYTFTNNLKSSTPQNIDSLNEGAVIPKIVKEHPNTIIALTWLNTLDKVEASELDTYKKSILKPALDLYLEVANLEEDTSNEIKKLNLSSPSGILNKHISSKTLEEANIKFYGKEDLRGFYTSRIEKVLGLNKLSLNEVDKFILDDASRVDKNLDLFRFHHEQTTWFMLAVITTLSLLLSWLFFSLQNRK